MLARTTTSHRLLATLTRSGLSSASFTCHPSFARSTISPTFTVPEPAMMPRLCTYTTWTRASARATKPLVHKPSSSISLSPSPTRWVSARSTSSSASRSSATASTTTSSAVTGTSATTAASTAAPHQPLSHHEEMTKVRFSYNWWKEWTIIMTVFAITGSSSVYFVKPILKNGLHLEGSMQEGPWSYRLTYICTTMPTYSITLLAIASLFGRRPYFQKVVLRMWSRFLPKKVLQRFQ